MNSGFWRIGAYKGAPILAHWSLLLGLLWYWLLGQRLLPAVLTFLAFLILLLAHELGHAFAAWLRRVEVYEIKLYLLHGLCRHAAPYRVRDGIFIAWGGVLAQACLLVLALALEYATHTLNPGLERVLQPAFRVFLTTNAFLIVFNLLPVAPLDGHRAWGILPLLGKRLTPRIRDAFRRAHNTFAFKKRRALAKDSEQKVVDLMERIRKK